ncbi:hypothetical protein KSP40_PGU003279 [Platanthera guangdongensis]|uniref:RNase H type-1 domain-containing protein n=1 Tax=Platanthera guangdongensis TaxID=2320717 RepID=A0ABR2MCM8_9ASPA
MDQPSSNALIDRASLPKEAPVTLPVFLEERIKQMEDRQSQKSRAGRSLMQWDPGRTEMAALAAIRDYLTVDCFDASGVIIEGDSLNLIKYCQRCFDSRLWDAHFPDADVLKFLFELPRVLFRYAPREANRAADFCSRYAIFCTFLWTCFEDFPPVLSEVVQSDQENILVF